MKMWRHDEEEYIKNENMGSAQSDAGGIVGPSDDGIQTILEGVSHSDPITNHERWWRQSFGRPWTELTYASRFWAGTFIFYWMEI